MRALSAPRIRLKRSFALHRISSEDREISMVATPTQGVNRTGFVLQFSTFPVVNILKSTSCRFGLVPEFSTPVEKTVEIHKIQRAARILCSFFAHLRKAKPRAARIPGLKLPDLPTR